MKHKVERPFGRRTRGGWVFSNKALLDALKKGQAVQIGKVMVGAKQLSDLIRLLPYEDTFIKANGRLEFETVERVFREDSAGVRKCGYRKPRHYHQYFAINRGAWLPQEYDPKRQDMTLVVIKPKKY